MQRNLRPFEKLLDNDTASGRAKSHLHQNFVDGSVCLRNRLANQDAFAQREAIRLDRTPSAESTGKSLCFLGLVKDPGTRGRNSAALHKGLRKCLGRFE